MYIFLTPFLPYLMEHCTTLQLVLIFFLNRPTLLFTSLKSDLKLWRQLKGGTDTKGGMETKFEGVIVLHVLMHSLTGPTLLFPASKSNLKHWRKLKGGADTKGGVETEFRGAESIYSLCTHSTDTIRRQGGTEVLTQSLFRGVGQKY